MNPLFSNRPIRWEEGLAFIRVITGLLVIYHGWEIFSSAKMNSYLEWEMFSDSAGKAKVYAGKAAELAAGLLLFFGFLTRIASVLLALVMAYIAFSVGEGRIWYEEQHPFLFVLLGLVFFFCGPGKWSMDAWINRKGGDHAR